MRSLQIVLGNHAGDKLAAEAAPKRYKKNKYIKISQAGETKGQSWSLTRPLGSPSSLTQKPQGQLSRQETGIALTGNLTPSHSLARTAETSTRSANLSLNMNLRTTRKYKQEFTIANMKFPILRAEFLLKFDLRIDLKKRVLISKNKSETIRSFRRRNATTITIINSDEEEPQPKHLVRKISSPRRTSTP